MEVLKIIQEPCPEVLKLLEGINSKLDGLESTISKMKQEDVYYSIDEICKKYHMSVSKLRRLRADYDFNELKAGRGILFKLADVESALRESSNIYRTGYRKSS